MEMEGTLLIIFTSTLVLLVESKSCEKTVLTDIEGRFQSPGYPSKYGNNLECDYIIKAEKNHYIEITFHVFKVEDRLSFSGKLVDFLEVFDGREDNRQQEAIYYGEISEPFKFVSKTNRVIMRFITDSSSVYNGFYATYKALPIPSQCENLLIHKGVVNCTRDQSGSKPVSCNVTCEDNYELLHGNGYVDCNLATIEEPKCKADAVKLDLCYADSTDPGCPFTADEIEHEMKAFLEEIEHISTGIARGMPNCPKRLCLYGKSRGYIISCFRYSNALKSMYKWADVRMLFWRSRCHTCQRDNCGLSRPYFAG